LTRRLAKELMRSQRIFAVCAEKGIQMAWTGAEGKETPMT